MYLDGNLLMKRISVGALIIALYMLTDNAIFITEGIKVRIESGEDKLHVIRDVISQNQWPLFGAMAIAVVAFAASPGRAHDGVLTSSAVARPGGGGCSPDTVYPGSEPDEPI